MIHKAQQTTNVSLIACYFGGVVAAMRREEADTLGSAFSASCTRFAVCWSLVPLTNSRNDSAFPIRLLLLFALLGGEGTVTPLQFAAPSLRSGVGSLGEATRPLLPMMVVVVVDDF